MAGKGKGSGGSAKKKSLTATVTALAKIVKKDHKMIAKSIDYSDYLFPGAIAAASYQTWNYLSLMQPIVWIPSLRRSNATAISPEVQLKEMNISICCNHGGSIYEASWFVAVVRAKKDWVPDATNVLRPDVDWCNMGPGSAPGLNQDKFVLLKSWSTTTSIQTQGEPSQATKRLVWKFKMNQLIRASAQTVGSSDQNWITNTETDFEPHERLYVIYYANSPINLNWGSGLNPSITVGARFTVCQI